MQYQACSITASIGEANPAWHATGQQSCHLQRGRLLSLSLFFSACDSVCLVMPLSDGCPNLNHAHPHTTRTHTVPHTLGSYTLTTISLSLASPLESASCFSFFALCGCEPDLSLIICARRTLHRTCAGTKSCGSKIPSLSHSLGLLLFVFSNMAP